MSPRPRRLRAIEGDDTVVKILRPNPDAPDAESYPIDRALVAKTPPYRDRAHGDSACVRCLVTWRTQEGESRRCWSCGRYGVKVAAGTALHRWKRGCRLSCPSPCFVEH